MMTRRWHGKGIVCFFASLAPDCCCLWGLFHFPKEAEEGSFSGRGCV